MPKRTRQSKPVPALAVLLAWLVPGAGHVYIGRVRRGIIIFATISATFWCGVAIGGVMTVDYQNERWWFVAQMCTGVHGVVSWQRQKRVYDDLDRRVAADEDYRRSARSLQGKGQWAAVEHLHQGYVDKLMAEDGVALVSPVDTVARSYAGVAGLLNLLCMFDVLMLSLMGVRGERVAAAPAKVEAGGADE